MENEYRTQINEGRKLDAFDMLEATMNLSNLYHRKDIEKDVTFYFDGMSNRFRLLLLDWETPDSPVLKFTISLSGTSDHDTLMNAWETIQKELEKYE